VSGADLSPEAVADLMAPAATISVGGRRAPREARLDVSGVDLSSEAVADLMAGAGLTVTARLVREPEQQEKTPQAYLIARKG
jgi:hypothetical protein